MTAQACTVYLVRHGETQWNKIGRMQGHTDIPLNESGIAQAQDVRAILKGIHFDAVYTSDLTRAIETARILINNTNVTIHTLSDLRERSFGTYEGKPSEDTWKELRPILDKHDDTNPLIVKNKVETNSQMRQRVLRALLSVGENNKGKNVLIVAHHGVMKQLLIHIGYSKTHHFPKGSIQNLAFVRLCICGNSISVDSTHGITFNY